MNFVHVEDFFHPDAGYQLNLLTKLQVQQGHRVTIVTSELNKIPDWLTVFFGKDNIEEKDQKFFERTGVKIIRIPIFFYYSGRSIYYPKLFKIVDLLKPDVLFVHGEDTMMGMQFIWRSSKQKYPMVLDCHMLEMASMNRFRKAFRFFYKNFITPKIIKNNIPLIRVVDSDYVEKCLGLPLNKTILLSFGTDTNFFKPDSVASKSFRAKYGIGEADFIILYAGKLDIYKGGQFLAESLKEKLVIASGRKIVFVIIGNSSGEYGQNVEKCFSESENKILRFHTQSYNDLAEFYQAADLSIFPKHCSMSFYEVQSCSIPVLFEVNEINQERAQHGNGFTFLADDINDFRSKMIYCAEMDTTKYGEIRKNARNYILDNFDYIPIAKKFTEVMITEYNRFYNVRNSKSSNYTKSNNWINQNISLFIISKIKRIIKFITKQNIYFTKSVKVNKKWYGNTYGGFFVCPEFLNENSIIYSFGIGEDISFDLSIIEKHGCNVYGFDPTPKSINWLKKQQNIPSKFNFFAYGIADRTGTMDFYLPKNSEHVSGSFVKQNNVNDKEMVSVEMKSWNDITKALGHHQIDVLKMDIEGAEYTILDSILDSSVQINQILIEFHDRLFDDGKNKTIEAIKKLKDHGYEIVGVADSFEEVSFIKKSILNVT